MRPNSLKVKITMRKCKFGFDFKYFKEIFFMSQNLYFIFNDHYCENQDAMQLDILQENKIVLSE